MDSENRIIKGINNGSGETFKEVFDHFYIPLRSFAYHYVENDQVTDDLVQDAFVKLWEKRKDFSRITPIKSYLYTTVKNACLDYLKHQKVRTKNDIQLKELFSTQNEEKFIIEEEVHAKIYEAINELPLQARRIIIMTMEGDSNPDIAKKLNISVNTVKTIKLRAYKTLRERLRGIQWIVFLFYIQ